MITRASVRRGGGRGETKRPSPARLFRALGDDTRLRILRLLYREELNVWEIGQILDIPQPSISRHLAVLRAEGLVVDRREGTRIYCTIADHPGGLACLETLVREVGESAHPDLGRLATVLAARRQAVRQFVDEQAEHWDDVVGMLHNSAASLLALANMVPRGLTIADLGTGTGLLLPVLAAMADQVQAVDQSGAMLRRARGRCRQAGLTNVAFHQAVLEELPDSFPPCDAMLLHFVLHQVARPAPLLAHLSRFLKPNGRLIVVDRCEHNDELAKEQFGSVWLGFARDKLDGWLRQAGMSPRFWQAVPGKEGGDPAFATFVCAAGR